MAYSDNFVSEALIRLAINKYDYKKTAAELDISPRTLKNWEKKVPAKVVPELLERAIEKMLIHIPTSWKGNDWAVAIGILMDKWLLVNGQATSRTDTNIVTMLQSLPDEELNDLIAEFESAANGVHTSQSGEDTTE